MKAFEACWRVVAPILTVAGTGFILYWLRALMLWTGLFGRDAHWPEWLFTNCPVLVALVATIVACAFIASFIVFVEDAFLPDDAPEPEWAIRAYGLPPELGRAKPKPPIEGEVEIIPPERVEIIPPIRRP